MPIGILGWRNETGLNNYPLASAFGVQNFILDARFIQFDRFIPVLQEVNVQTDYIYVSILTDAGTVVVTLTKSTFTDGEVHKLTAASGRNLGKVVFGMGANTLWTNFVNQDMTPAIPFLSCVVQSVPSSAGVYSIAGAYGDVRIIADSNIFYDDLVDGVKLNAVGLPSVIPGSGKVLKTINGLSPVDNAIIIQDSATIKIGMAQQGLTVNLVAADLSTYTSIIPSS